MTNLEYNTISIRLGTSDIHSVYQVWHLHEYKPIVDVMKKHGIKEPVIIDAGAYIGMASLYFHSEFPGARIMALEPDSHNQVILLSNLGYSDRVRLRPHALAHFSGHGRMVSPDNDPSAWAKTLVRDDEYGACKVYTFLQLLQTYSLTHIHLLKLDIEGSERGIFEHDADNILPRIKYLAMDIHERQYPGTRNIVIEALERHNFLHWTKGETLFAYDKKLEPNTITKIA